MYAQITVLCVSSAVTSDILALESTAPEAAFMRMAGTGGTTVVIRCTGATWDRLRPSLRRLSDMRLPAVTDAGVRVPNKTRPALTYSVDWVPGGRPRIHQVEGAVSVGAGTNTLTVRGENLLAGTQAKLDIQRELILTGNEYAPAGTLPRYNNLETVLTITAVAKGPNGRRIGFLVLPATGGGSVSVEEYADGLVGVIVTPAAGANTATAIAAQVAGSALASVWITATAVVGAALIPAFVSNGEIVGPNIIPGRPFRYLTGGDGGGVAIADLLVSGVDPTNRLRIAAQRAGNDSNNVSITLLGGQGADAVSVSGTNITVTRIAATTAIGTLATAINANAAANALVQATAVGAGSLGNVTQTWLCGGGGEQPVAQVGGAPATITLHTDISMVVSVTGAALTTAGVAAGEVVGLNVLMDYQRVTMSLVAVA